MYKLNQHCVVALICGFIMIFLSSDVFAQNESLKPIYSGIPIGNIAWSSDSQKLIFQDSLTGDTLLSGERYWHSYDITTQSSVQSATWPEQPALTSDLAKTFNVENGADAESRLLYLSPNGHYIIGGDELALNAPLESSTLVADLQSDRLFSIPIPALGISSGPDSFNVHWSNDSEVFTLLIMALQVSAPSYIYYVKGYNENPANLTLQDMTSFIINDQEYSTMKIFDVSSNGERVLVHGSYIIPASETREYDYGFPLVVWNAKDASQHFVIDEFNKSGFNLRSVSFAPDNDNQILVLNEQGLVQYDLLTKKTTILRADLNSMWANEALFSPDGNWLALTEGEVVENIYLIDLRN
jgi:hypothetical protein